MSDEGVLSTKGMMTQQERHERLTTLFAEASEMPVEQRDAFMVEACGGDNELLSELRSLLEADTGDVPLMDAEPNFGWKEEAIDQVGPYRVTGVLGEGGMGVVYEAEQSEPLRRRVALKVIRLGMDSKAVVARFEAERQALALMEHSGIARVYDAGVTERGRPWFAMELVDGVPITRYCATSGSTSPPDWRCLLTSATPSSTPTRRASSTATSSRATFSWPRSTAARCRR